MTLSYHDLSGFAFPGICSHLSLEQGLQTIDRDPRDLEMDAVKAGNRISLQMLKITGGLLC